ncbi:MULTISPECIES: LysM peptidoglycan-binding domain-containing protein [Myroides]|uniref:LysM peptidoglycan-binding domain-containing protein n=1 Tax=Myroides albus TaxID=2562892 RepID=A0A6I3LIL0_9FLAO|nr:MULTISPECIES: LysM peptidoglycan-binding domain-containing protein [Myroides]MTG98408.1 LysM peptidoglycan-binding domain-containing protein [Myroides albus]MVX36465.1 LysM peptidoglycan-binding domain-containing protein [Myroides sp. LoEW2-1]UVD79680.1 LysM peptidoglycan-binding domain-containing protein [Myroides albus]
MRKNFIAALAAFMISFTMSAQDSSFVQYRVVKGDTVSKIAREYSISVKDILTYNPDAKNGIKEGGFILIPTKEFLNNDNQSSKLIANSTSKSTQDYEDKTHYVQPKETLYGISKMYKVTVDQLYQWNPTLKQEGLKAESIIVVGRQRQIARAKDVTGRDKSTPNYNGKLMSSSADTIKDISNIYYKYIDVEPQSTLYGLAVLYNTTIQRLMELNPELKDGLKSGQKIKVPAFGFKDEVIEVTPIAPQGGEVPEYITIKVKPKQTLYSISREYDLSITELVELNKELLSSGLQVGMELKVPNVAGIVQDVEEEGKEDVVFAGEFANLEESLYVKQSKEIALLLPFNISRLGESVEGKLSSDNFLNMTLDFYLGAKLAIEKIEDLGLPLTVNVYDSNESKNSSAILDLIKAKSFANTDVIIGPFFQTNVEQTVQNLPNKDIVVVSPLSNEKLIASDQLIQTMPYADVLKKELLDYFIKQPDVKLTVIVDPKRTSTKEFMTKYYSHVKTINTSALNDIDKTLVSGKNNVFVLDSGSIESASLLVNKLKRRVKDFNIQIATLDKGEVFENSEIDIQSLIDLKYTYPSVTRDSNNSLEESNFQNLYKEKYNVLPSRFATRGYDVMYDVIMRSFQKGGFKSTFKYKTHVNENKFEYSKNPEGGIRNTGVYLLQYTEDLTVKQLQ